MNQSLEGRNPLVKSPKTEFFRPLLCYPSWASSNPAGPFLLRKSLLATKAQQLELSVGRAANGRDSQQHSVALLCLCNGTDAHRESCTHSRGLQPLPEASSPPTPLPPTTQSRFIPLLKWNTPGSSHQLDSSPRSTQVLQLPEF